MTTESKARTSRALTPGSLTWQLDGFCWREALVKLSPDVSFHDLLDPAIWRSIQGSPQTRLRTLDRVTVIAADASWAALDLVVVTADEAGACFAIKPTNRITLTRYEGAT